MRAELARPAWPVAEAREPPGKAPNASLFSAYLIVKKLPPQRDAPASRSGLGIGIDRSVGPLEDLSQSGRQCLHPGLRLFVIEPRQLRRDRVEQDERAALLAEKNLGRI